MIFAELKNIVYLDCFDKNEAQMKMLNDIYQLQLSLQIGKVGELGGDDFDVDIVSIGFVKKEKIFLGTHSIIVDINDIDELEEIIKNFVNSIRGNSWKDVLYNLRRHFKWEYENLEFI